MRLARSWDISLRLALPVLLSAVTALGLFAAVRWSAARSDFAAAERQQALVRTILAQSEAEISHDQESATVWDDAVTNVRNNNLAWIDVNIGKWMLSYYHHDGAFVLRSGGEMIYGISADTPDPTAAFRLVRDAALPLVAKLRARLSAGDVHGISDQVLSIGEMDLSIVNGHPALVSVKPIVSESGTIAQKPGTEFLHVAVRYLDGSMLKNTERDYQLDDLSFTWNQIASTGRSYSALTTTAGKVLGYFSWKPFRPGAKVASETLPAIAGTAAFMFLIVSALSAVISKRSRRLDASQAELQHLASHDRLTGLVNRGVFNSRLAKVVSLTTKDQCNAVLFVDLDRFKQVNDTLGHPVGDEVIITVAGRLKDVLGPVVISRIGGDEFTVLLEDTSQVQVATLCESVIEAVRRPIEIGGQQIAIGMSIGVAFTEGRGSDPSDLMRKADIALYHAKAAGRGRYAIFGAHMDELMQARRALEGDLRRAFEDGGQLAVHYQPVYDAATASLTGVEALLRWHHPKLGPVAPDVFIPLAEEIGLIERLGTFVIEDACETASQWPSIEVAVNASAIELRSETYVIRVLAALNRFSVAPGRLEIELTESALMDDCGQCARNIAAMRVLGMRVALDDFGTGFSSFWRLQHVEVDRIKIDKSFVDACSSSGGNPAIVRAMIDLAHAKGLKTTAEGVETDEQRDLLRELGCDQLQGYLLSRPLAKDQLATLLETAGRETAGV